MARTILVNNNNSSGYGCEKGDCIWLEADDVEQVYKSMSGDSEGGSIVIRMKDGFKYTMNYRFANSEEMEEEFQRYIAQITKHQSKPKTVEI